MDIEILNSDKEILGTYKTNYDKVLRLCYIKKINDFIIDCKVSDDFYDTISGSLHDIDTLDINEPYYDKFKTIIKSYKKHNKQTLSVSNSEIKLSGIQVRSNTTIDVELKKLFQDKEMSLSKYAQQAIIEKLQRDNLL